MNAVEKTTVNKLLGLLQTIVLGLLGWQLTQTTEIKERLARIEAILEHNYEKPKTKIRSASTITNTFDRL